MYTFHHTPWVWAVALILTLGACQTPPESSLPVSKPGPTATPTPTPEPTPTPTPLPTPKPTAVPTPTVTPVATVTPVPTATATPVPTPTPTPTPVPTATPVPLAKVVGTLTDDNGSPVNNGTITIKSNDVNIAFDGKSTFENGRYIIPNVPTNISLTVIGTGPGFNSRSYSLIIPSDKTEATVAFKDKFAISTKPEIVSVSPPFNSTYASYTEVTLTFSENMDKTSVERSFAIQSNVNVDTTFAVGTLIPKPLTLIARPTDSVFDINHFNITWDTDRVLKLKPKYRWPIAVGNSNFRMIFTYKDVNNNGGGIKDSDGNMARTTSISTSSDSSNSTTVTTEDGPVFVNNKYQPYIPFSVQEESGAKDPFVDTFLVSNDSAAEQGDVLTFIFNEIMSFSLTTGDVVVGGANGVTGGAPAGHAKVTAQQAAKNYTIVCNGTQVTLPASAVAVFDDPKTVKLRVTAPDQLFTAGQNCTVTYSGIRSTLGKNMSNIQQSFVVP